VGAGLLPAPDGETAREAGAAILDRLLGRFARERPPPGLEPVLAAGSPFGALVDATRREQLAERRDDLAAPVLGAGRQELAHEMARVVVDDQTRQPVGLREHEPTGAVRTKPAEPPAPP